MRTFKCKSCGYTTNLETSEYFICPNCGYEEEYDESDNIDSIINSVIEDVLLEKKQKIINKDDKNKSLDISPDNRIISKSLEKCANCGLCKKTCEDFANLSYDLNVCDKPVCTNCGACVLACPNGALTFKHNYREIKSIIDLNEKIVVAIVDPSVYPYLHELTTNTLDVETKLVGALKKLGFDYVFNGAYAGDLSILEEVTEFAERLKNKQLLPMFTSSCPSWTAYAEIYHPEIIKNISTCKTPLQMHSAVIKDYFEKVNGFEKSKVITVGISTCTSLLDNYKDRLNLDYSLPLNELMLLLEEEEIDIDDVTPVNYDPTLSECSASSYLRSKCGGESEAFVRTFYRIMKKSKLKENEIDFIELRDVDGFKEATIKILDYPLRIAIVEGLVNLEKIMKDDKYKHYHLIEVMNCKSGCIGGSGRLFNTNNVNLNIDKIYKKDKESSKRCAHDNKEIKQLYKEMLNKPLSEKCLEILHRNYIDRSNLVKNKLEL